MKMHKEFDFHARNEYDRHQNFDSMHDDPNKLNENYTDVASAKIITETFKSIREE